MVLPNNLNKLLKAELIDWLLSCDKDRYIAESNLQDYKLENDHLKVLLANTEESCDELNANFKDLSKENEDLKSRLDIEEQENSIFRDQIETLNKRISDFETENFELKSSLEEQTNKAEKRKNRLRERIQKDQKRRQEREDAINGLFSLYSTVLLEDKWNDRIEWKNDVLAEIQYLIRYLG